MRIGITGYRGMPDESAQLVKAALRLVVSGYPAGDLVGCPASRMGGMLGSPRRLSRAVGDVSARKYRESLPVWHH